MSNILNVWDGEKYVSIPAIVGKSAYELAVENGYMGTLAEWLESLQGAKADSVLDISSTNAIQNKVVAEKFNEISGEIADLNIEIDAIFQGTDILETLDNIAWTLGRIDSGSHVTSSAHAYSDIIPKNENLSVVFDTAKYKVLYVYYDGNGIRLVSSSWKTTSPLKPWDNIPSSAKGATSVRIQLNRLAGSGLDISVLQNDIKFITNSTENVIAKKIANLESKAITLYVDGTNGNDNNDGTSQTPFKTISKAIETITNDATAIIYVTSGDYGEQLVFQEKKSVKIMLWEITAFSATDGVLTLPMIRLSCGTQTTGITGSNCENLEFSDIWVDGTTGNSATLNKIKDLKFTHCMFSNSGDSNNGLNINNSNAIVRNCIAYDIGKDGFNLHGFGNSTFIDCVAHDCGDDGISHHDGCTGSIIGGEFYNCVKGGVSSPTYGADISVQGVYSHNNAYGLYTTTSSSEGYKQSNARVCNSVFKNNTTKDVLIRGTNAVMWNTSYDTKQVDSSGLLTEF